MAGVAANSYAEALFELGLETKQLNVYKEQLMVVDALLKEHDDFNQVLNHPKISKQEKKALLDTVYAKELDKNVLNFLKLLIDKGRFSLFSQIVKAFVKAYNKEHNIAVAYVKSAVTLSEKQTKEIQSLLESKLSKTVELHVSVDEELLAGIRIKVDDLVIDNSASMRLAKMKEQVKITSEQ